VPRPSQYVDGCHQMCILLKTTCHTGKYLLRNTVFFRNLPAFRAGLRGVLRRHKVQNASRPGQLVRQHAPEGVPPLVQDGLVKARFLSYSAPWGFDGSFGRCTHVPHPQVLHRYDRVWFLLISVKGCVQVVVTCIGYTDVKTRYFLFLFAPIVRNFTILGLMCSQQPGKKIE
jgi:hypothetical protein